MLVRTPGKSIGAISMQNATFFKEGWCKTTSIIHKYTIKARIKVRVIPASASPSTTFQSD